MAQSSWPFENADTTEVQYSKLARRFHSTTVVMGALVSTGTGMQVRVATGQAVIQGFYWESTATENISIPTAHASLPRKDCVVLRLDLTANSIVLALKQGTPASSPVRAALSQTDVLWEHPIADITVGANVTSITSGNIVNLPQSLDHALVVYASTSARPTPSAPTVGLNTGTKEFDFFNGTTWTSMAPSAPTWSSITGKPTTFSPSSHTHAQSDITGLATALVGKASTNHTHAQSDITGLATALAGKADSSHTHPQSDVTGLATALAGKSDTGHTHTAGDVSGIAAVKVNNAAAADDAAKIGGRTIFTQTAQPSSSGRVNGDIWISW